MVEFDKTIIRQKVRILRPSEYTQFLSGVTKQHHRIFCQTLLYTGMRYIELQRFHDYPEWFDGNFIHLPEMADRKVKRTQPERWVRLNPSGKVIVEFFTKMEEKLPAYQNWRDDMRRWAKKANLNPDGFGTKSLRKTWESWLTFYYPIQIPLITLSQGHDAITAIRHYLNMPFTDIDKLEMKQFVEGWV